MMATSISPGPPLELPGEVHRENDVIQDTKLYAEGNPDGVHSTTDPELVTFHIFERQVYQLQDEVRGFSQEVRQMGLSIGLTVAANNLHECLVKVHLITKNSARRLFPVGMTVVASDGIPAAAFKPSLFRETLVCFSQALGTLLTRLREYRIFDEALQSSGISLMNDLEYWIGLLQKYKERIYSPEIRLFAYAIAIEMGGHFAVISPALRLYTTTGLPAVLKEQNLITQDFVNISTVATFFSATTATTLQIAYTLDQADVALVNFFWFTSLIFSIAAVLNSTLLGLSWMQSIFNSRSYVPLFRWVFVYIQGSPVLFLIVAIVCFSTGVVLLVYKSEQSQATEMITVVSTFIMTLGLVGAVLAFTYEQWINYCSRSKRPQFPYHKEDSTTFKISQVVKQILRGLTTIITRGSTKFYPDDTEKAPGSSFELELVPSINDQPPSLLRIRNDTPRNRVAEKWSVLAAKACKRAEVGTGRPLRVVTKLFVGNDGSNPLHAAISDEHLSSFHVMQSFRQHMKHIAHTQFSPDGSKLAVASWGEGMSIFSVRAEFKFPPQQLLAKCRVSQVVWSENGDYIAVRAQPVSTGWPCITIIDAHTGDEVMAITRKAADYICWAADGPGPGLLVLEHGELVKINLGLWQQRPELTTYNVDDIKLRSIAQVPQLSRLLISGCSMVKRANLDLPPEPRLEKQLCVYNCKTRQIEDTVPFLDDVRLYEVSRNGRDVLIGCRVGSPPQLWKLKLIRRPGEFSFDVRLALRHRYGTHKSTQCDGNACFAGEAQQFILSATTAGNILIWDRESPKFVREIRASTLSSEITSLSWNPGSTNSLMFAAASLDGSVYIWTNGVEDGNGTSKLLGTHQQKMSKQHLGGNIAEFVNMYWRKFSVPEGFSRPIDREKYLPDEFLPTRIQSLDQLSTSLPRIPTFLYDLDVQLVDWVRLIQDMSHAWTGHDNALSAFGDSSRQTRINVITAFINVWNDGFFSRRGMELVLHNTLDGELLKKEPQRGGHEEITESTITGAIGPQRDDCYELYLVYSQDHEGA